MLISPRRMNLAVICFGCLGMGFGLAFGAVLSHEIGREWVMLIALPFVVTVVWAAGKVEALNQDETEELIRQRVEDRYLPPTPSYRGGNTKQPPGRPTPALRQPRRPPMSGAEPFDMPLCVLRIASAIGKRFPVWQKTLHEGRDCGHRRQQFTLPAVSVAEADMDQLVEQLSKQAIDQILKYDRPLVTVVELMEEPYTKAVRLVVGIQEGWSFKQDLMV